MIQAHGMNQFEFGLVTACRSPTSQEFYDRPVPISTIANGAGQAGSPNWRPQYRYKLCSFLNARPHSFTTIHHHLSIHGQTTCPPHPTTLTQHRTTHHNTTISSTTPYLPSLIPLAASLLLESKHSSHLASGSIVIWDEVDSDSRRTGTSRDSASPDSAGQGGRLLSPRGCPWFTLIIRFAAWVHW